MDILKAADCNKQSVQTLLDNLRLFLERLVGSLNQEEEAREEVIDIDMTITAYFMVRAVFWIIVIIFNETLIGLIPGDTSSSRINDQVVIFNLSVVGVLQVEQIAIEYLELLLIVGIELSEHRQIVHVVTDVGHDASQVRDSHRPVAEFTQPIVAVDNRLVFRSFTEFEEPAAQLAAFVERNSSSLGMKHRQIDERGAKVVAVVDIFERTEIALAQFDCLSVVFDRLIVVLEQSHSRCLLLVESLERIAKHEVLIVVFRLIIWNQNLKHLACKREIDDVVVIEVPDSEIQLMVSLGRRFALAEPSEQLFDIVVVLSVDVGKDVGSANKHGYPFRIILLDEDAVVVMVIKSVVGCEFLEYSQDVWRIFWQIDLHSFFPVALFLLVEFFSSPCRSSRYRIDVVLSVEHRAKQYSKQYCE